MIRRTGVATAVVSTLGIAIVNTTGVAQSESAPPGSLTTAGALGGTIEPGAPATGGPTGDPLLEQLSAVY
nr:hypothetical protein [Micromonospora sp. DSM 115978]